MATLYKRANSRQRQILRIVEGAVHNVLHVHERGDISDERFARSIAKRAAGTLTARWPDVLASPLVVSDSAPTESSNRAAPRKRLNLLKPTGRGPSHRLRRSPLPELWTEIASHLWYLRRDGSAERYQAFVDVLRAIDAIQKGRDPSLKRGANDPAFSRPVRDGA